MMARKDAESKFLGSIVFNDEAMFISTGKLSKHNCRFWSVTNPHWMREQHTQYLQNVNVQGSILDNSTVPQDLDDLRRRIVEKVELISSDIIRNAVAGF